MRDCSMGKTSFRDFLSGAYSRIVVITAIVSALLLTGCPARPGPAKPVPSNATNATTIKKTQKIYPMSNVGEPSNTEYDISPYTVTDNELKYKLPDAETNEDELKAYAKEKLEKIDFQGKYNIRGTFQDYQFDIVISHDFTGFRADNGMSFIFTRYDSAAVGYNYPEEEYGPSVVLSVYKDPSDKFLIVTDCADYKVISEFFRGVGCGTQPSPTPTPIPIADPCEIHSDQYRIIMNKIEELDTSSPGLYKFNITVVTDENNRSCYLVLTTYHDSEEQHFVVYNGSLTEAEDVPFKKKPQIKNARTYEELKKLPFLLDTQILLHDEVLSDGKPGIDILTPIASNIEDGEYYGKLIGISEDGTRILVQIGKPVVLSYDKLKGLNPGDPVGYKDFKVTEIKQGKIHVESQKLDKYYSCSFQKYESERRSTDKAFLMFNTSTWLDDTVIIELDLAESCKVFVVNEFISNYEDMPKDWKINGSPMQKTLLFSKRINDPYLISAKNNGWYPIDSGRITSIIIESGQVIEIETYC